MSGFDLVGMAVRNLFKRKLRTFLTVLGVVIGSASIVVMVSLGVGMNKQFEEMLSQAGNILVIRVESEAYWNDSAPKGVPLVDDNNLLVFEKMKGVDIVTPVVKGNFQLASGKYMGWGEVIGIDMTLFEALGFKIEEGRKPELTDKNGVIFGGRITENFYNPKQRNPWANPPELDPFEDDFQLYVSTIMDERGKYIAKPAPLTVTATTSKDGDSAYAVYMDADTVRSLNAEQKKIEDKYYKDNNIKNNRPDQSKKGYAMAFVKCATMDDVSTVQQQIRDMGFYAYSNGDWLSSMKQTSDSLQGLLGAIGAVSLLVAAIGIANTMLMSIYERTKEIGVMKVIGATLSDIEKLFLVEAAVIGFFGGLFGLLVSFGLSYVLNNWGGLAFLSNISWLPQDTGADMSIIPLWLCGGALAFSTVVGVVSGYLPARRAMKLSALAAIRAE